MRVVSLLIVAALGADTKQKVNPVKEVPCQLSHCGWMILNFRIWKVNTLVSYGYNCTSNRLASRRACRSVVDQSSGRFGGDSGFGM